jgi:hypothetical protein
MKYLFAFIFYVLFGLIFSLLAFIFVFIWELNLNKALKELLFTFERSLSTFFKLFN